MPLKTSVNLDESFEEFYVKKPALALFLNDEFKQTLSLSDQWTFTFVCTISCCGQGIREAEQKILSLWCAEFILSLFSSVGSLVLTVIFYETFH